MTLLFLRFLVHFFLLPSINNKRYIALFSTFTSRVQYTCETSNCGSRRALVISWVKSPGAGGGGVQAGTHNTHTQNGKNGKWCKDCHLHGHVPPVPKDQDSWALHRHFEPAHWHLFSWSRARNSQETLTVPLDWCWHPKSNLNHSKSALSMGLDVTALFATPAKDRSLFYS